jgi:hypothetical protein
MLVIERTDDGLGNFDRVQRREENWKSRPEGYFTREKGGVRMWPGTKRLVRMPGAL